jgi:hypothetical protein
MRVFKGRTDGAAASHELPYLRFVAAKRPGVVTVGRFELAGEYVRPDGRDGGVAAYCWTRTVAGVADQVTRPRDQLSIWLNLAREQGFEPLSVDLEWAGSGRGKDGERSSAIVDSPADSIQASPSHQQALTHSPPEEYATCRPRQYGPATSNE